MSKPKTKPNRKPRILVMEGLHGAANCVRRSGGEPISVNPRSIADVDEALARPFDGLLLTGGGDVDPRLYGEKPHRKVYGVSETRDYTEWIALDRAAELGVPVMGICRGMQLMTVHNGGALRQHIGGHRGGSHLVFGESGARFRRIIGGERGHFVSLHHQVVKRTGNGWRVAARAKDGIIEAVESRDGRCVGVQFHPEMDYGQNECSRRLFGWLVAESAKRAGLAKPKPAVIRAPERAPVKPRERTLQQQLDLSLAQVADVRHRHRRPVQKGVAVTWVCRECGLRFDKQVDRDDHEYWICGDPQMRVTEPPPGHPDWL
jgi:putative glutamine amidotransferase